MTNSLGLSHVPFSGCAGRQQVSDVYSVLGIERG